MTSFPTPYVGQTELRWMKPLSNWLRWGAIGLSILLIAAGAQPVSAPVLIGSGLVLIAFAAFRTIPQLGARTNLRAVLTFEPVLVMAAVVASGGFASPFAICVAVPVVFAAMALGVRVLWLVGGVIAILSLDEVLDSQPAVVDDIAQAVTPLLVAAATGILARRVVRSAEDTQSLTLGRLQELSHVNALLSTLHDLVRATSAPLTVEAIMSSVSLELEELFEPDAVVLLLGDRGGRFWRTGFVQGTPARGELSQDELPPALIAHEKVSRAIAIADLGADGGLDPDAVSGTYLWLWSQGRPSALLAIEHRTPTVLSEERAHMLDRLAPPLGLAIDNAVWFRRLRTLGAEEERQRIGAELHDQFAQSLVYVAMELDRTTERYPDDEYLGGLRDEVRRTLADLRDTLRELRLKVTEDVALSQVLVELLQRFETRYGITARLEMAADLPRPALPIENQLLRIVQDLLLLSRREAAASRVVVTITGDAGRLRLVVSDDGRGVEESDMGHQAASLLSLVRERADAIGALVDVRVRSGDGTDVAVTVQGLY